MGRSPKYTFLQEEIQMANEKMLNAANYKRKANKNYN